MFTKPEEAYSCLHRRVQRLEQVQGGIMKYCRITVVLVVAAALLALHYFRKGNDAVAAGCHWCAIN